VHGNTTPENTWKNALRLSYAFGKSGESGVKVYAGATKPLVRAPQVDEEIHGLDGLGGVEGLTAFTDPLIQARAKETEGLRAVEAMATAVKETWKHGEGQQVTLIATGPQTNLALFLSVYRDLLPAIEEIVFMGGAVGIGNRGPLAGKFLHRCFSGGSHNFLPFQNGILSVIVSRMSSGNLARY